MRGAILVLTQDQVVETSCWFESGQEHQQSCKISMAWLRTLFVAFRRGVLDIEELCYTYSGQGEFMHGRHRLTDTEIAEIRRRRPGVRVSLACEGMCLTAEEEALFERMDHERLTAEQRAARIVQFGRAKRRKKAPAST
jgi:hypothetical protein